MGRVKGMFALSSSISLENFNLDPQNSPPKYPKHLLRQKIGQKLRGSFFTGGSFRKGMAVPIGVPGVGVWGRVEGGGGRGFSSGK